LKAPLVHLELAFTVYHILLIYATTRFRSAGTSSAILIKLTILWQVAPQMGGVVSISACTVVP